jgi:miniconductance mechanosensitive channel
MLSALTLLNQYPILERAVGVLAVILFAYLTDRVARRVIVATTTRIARETSFQFDDTLLEFNVFGRAAHMAPALTIYFGINLVPNVPEVLGTMVQRGAAASMVLIGVSALAAFLGAAGQTYAMSSLAEDRPIEAYVQVTKIALYVIGIVLFIATLTGQSPLLLLSGIGAITAVLLLVFRDTILSFVASLQMASYDMVRVGDWIEMPQYGADGDVIELSLHTVKIQNFDKTITAVPTHKLIEQPFKNWRGMQDSGGRRIKRSFFIDTSSIRFLEEEDLDRLENFAILRDYVRQKRQEMADFNKSYAADPSLIVNSRRLTNVGTLRAYLVAYLEQHPKIHQNMTLIVRQLAPTAEGLPIELYVFSNITDWAKYEGIQSDIFDHIFSIVHEFDLRVFQAPSGTDFVKLGESREHG